jgi:TRAP-type C4-dicarboxylate transport system permease small subunit
MTPQPESRGAFAPFVHALSDHANRWSERALFVLIAGMVLVTMAQIIFRFLFDALTWSEELACFLLVFASLAGSAVAFKRGSHIAITFLSEKLPKGARRILSTVVYLLGLGFFIIVAVYGVVLMKAEGEQTTPALQISMAWIYLMYPLAGTVTAIHLIDGIVRVWERGTQGGTP